MEYPLCDELAKIWGNCGWAEALPLSIRCKATRYEFRRAAEPFLKNNTDYFRWLKEFPAKYPEKAKRLSQSIVD